MPDEELRPIAATCPACQAKPGERCTHPTDTGRREVNWFHLARIEEARYPLLEEHPDGSVNTDATSVYVNSTNLLQQLRTRLLMEEHQIESLEAIRTRLVNMKKRFEERGDASEDFLNGIQESIYSVTHVKGELEALHRMHQRQAGVKF